MSMAGQIIEILDSDMLGNSNLDPKPSNVVWDHISVLQDLGTGGISCQSKHRRRGKQLRRTEEPGWFGLGCKPSSGPGSPGSSSGSHAGLVRGST